MSLLTLMQAVLDKCRLNTALFAETISYTPAGETAAVDIPAHVRYKRRVIKDERTGDTRMIDELKVEISREALPGGPQGGDRLLRTNETRSYQYAYEGGETPVSWKATYHREIVTSQRGRKL